MAISACHIDFLLIFRWDVTYLVVFLWTYKHIVFRHIKSFGFFSNQPFCFFLDSNHHVSVELIVLKATNCSHWKQWETRLRVLSFNCNQRQESKSEPIKITLVSESLFSHCDLSGHHSLSLQKGHFLLNSDLFCHVFLHSSGHAVLDRGSNSAH